MPIDPALPPQLGTRFGNINERMRRFEAPGIWHAVTFQNSWTDYGGDFEPAAYRRFLDVVELRGLITKAVAPPVGQVIFTLPVGYRPFYRIVFLVADGAATASRFDVHANGQVTFSAGSAAGVAAYASLSQISFSTAPVLA